METAESHNCYCPVCFKKFNKEVLNPATPTVDIEGQKYLVVNCGHHTMYEMDAAAKKMLQKQGEGK